MRIVILGAVITVCIALAFLVAALLDGRRERLERDRIAEAEEKRRFKKEQY